MFGSWQKQQVNLRSSRNNKAISLAPGRTTHSLEPMKDRLLPWIFEKSEQDMPILINQVVIKAVEWDPIFAVKSSIARYSSAWRFIQKHGYVYYLGTNESQRSPLETVEEALAFVNNAVVRPKVSGGPQRHPDFIINMDQTPVPFTLNAKGPCDLCPDCHGLRKAAEAFTCVQRCKERQNCRERVPELPRRCGQRVPAECLDG